MSVGEDVKKLALLYITHGDVKWCSRCGKNYNSSSKNLNKELPGDPVVSLLAINSSKL